MLTAALAAGAVAGGLVARGVFAPRSGLFGPVRWHGPRDGAPRIALTFDDGPHPRGTPGVLEVLAELDVPATFFVIGRHVEAHPDLVRCIVESGHAVGNHTYAHARDATFRSRRHWRDELARADAAIADAAGVVPRWFRPPMGFKTPLVMRAARDGGRVVVTWSRRGFDGRPTTAPAIRRRLAGPVGPGDIVLLHDGVEPGGRRDPCATVEALPELVRAWRERGLEVVPLAELLGIEAHG